MQEINKEIRLGKLKPSEFKFGMGNPRVISPEALESLKKSMLEFGDFGVFVIDEQYNLISGHQRYEALRDLNMLETPVDCKMLIGYSEQEKKAINIRANTNSGEWDSAELEQWLSELENQGFDIELTGFDKMDENVFEPEDAEEKPTGRVISNMEPYKKIHVLLSFTPEAFAENTSTIDALGGKPGVECEIGAN